MKNNKIVIGFLSAIVILASLMLISIPFADAYPHTGIIQTNNHTNEPITEIIPLADGIGIEKTVLILHAPADNALPWGYVEGKIANHVPDYPVIIQIYDADGKATHFAQTNVKDDGSYEYRFRVRNVDDDKVINIFEGNYIVKIFKVVYLEINSSQV